MSGKRSSRQSKKERPAARVGARSVLDSRTEHQASTDSGHRKTDEIWSDDLLSSFLDPEPEEQFVEDQDRLADLIISSWIDLLEERVLEQRAGSSRTDPSRCAGSSCRSAGRDSLAQEIHEELRGSLRTRPKREWDEHTFIFARHKLTRQRPPS
jgi:hypothetical protein